MPRFIFWRANMEKCGWWTGKCACKHNLYWQLRNLMTLMLVLDADWKDVSAEEFAISSRPAISRRV
jgi:hypothetical protein